MKLLSAPASPFGRKVKVVAIEKGVMDRIEYVALATAPSAPSETLARDNPLIKIPTLVLDDGRSLYDSFVICDYLDALHAGNKVIPAGGARRWEVLKVHALGSGISDAAVLCRYENVLRPEALRWPDWTQGQMKKIAGSLDWLESDIAVIGNAGASDADLGQIAVACNVST
jgi:glutathione S-transferase